VIIRKGEVQFKVSYAVDLDDPRMVEKARELLYEDLDRIVHDGDIADHITINESVDIKESSIDFTRQILNIT
tara:strand:+ start:1808 stop:2023 length:216 start_codon:yes stop_codon:yes gene_type:complete